MAHLKTLVITGTLLACAVCFAGPYGDLQHQLQGAKTPDEVINLVSGSRGIADQPDIKDKLNSASDEDVDRKNVAQDLRDMVGMAALSEQRVPPPIDKDQANQIKQSPFYRDQGVDRKRNWFSDAIERLKNIHLKPKEDTEPVPAAFPMLGQLAVYAIWTLLIGAILTLLVYMIRLLDWRNALTRKAKTLLEEDEPERTLDEWLELADAHSAGGRYREAVRALYLACLLKFDEHNVARFDRGETNWEHLARIQASPNRPESLDFTEATRRFDRIWYGRQTRGQEDVDLFRGWYQAIKTTLEAPK